MDSTALVDAFLAEGEKLTRELPFAFLAEADAPFDGLALAPLVYLHWAASRKLLVDTRLAEKILESVSPAQAMGPIRAALGDQIHLHVLAPEAQAFTRAYYCTGGRIYFLDEFFRWLPHFDAHAAGVTWTDLAIAPGLLDARLCDWQNGDPWKHIDDPADTEHTILVDTPVAASPMLPDAWIDRLALLSASVRDHASSVAYADHFYSAVVGAPTDAMLQAAFREFCRSPRHDTSMLQSAVNFLGAAPLDQYARVYAKALPELLAADPDTALSMFDYPGTHLDRRQIDHLITQIVLAHPNRGVLVSLALVAVDMNAADDDPFDALVAAAGVG